MLTNDEVYTLIDLENRKQQLFINRKSKGDNYEICKLKDIYFIKSGSKVFSGLNQVETTETTFLSLLIQVKP